MLLNGISIGNFNISTLHLIVVGIVLVGTFVLVKAIRYFLRRFFERSSVSQKFDPTNYKFFSNAISFIIYLIAFTFIIYTIPSLRSFSLTLLASAGIFAAILGFASQQAFANIISGLFIVVFKPFRVNDLVMIGDSIRGVVEDITLRHTVIRDFENKRIIMPNSVISSETIINSNFMDQKIRRWVEFRISLDADVDEAIRILREEAEAHPNSIDNRTPEEKEKGIPMVIIRTLEVDEQGVLLRAYVWAEEPILAFEMNTELNYTVKKRFDEAGIEIPYPYRKVIMTEGNPTKKQGE